jgi:hypothetical protein
MPRCWTTISLTDSDDTDVPVEVTYDLQRGYPATRYEPAEADDIDIISATVDGKDAPQWVYDWLNGDYGYAALCDDAGAQLEQAACDAAEWRMGV